jgi:hypothetical protein
MYENVKNHPAFIAFKATETPGQEMGAAVDEEKEKRDENNETAAE